MGVELTSLDGDPIYFTGIVVEARFKGVGETGNLYAFQLRPWFWLAGRARQQRIFHEKSIPGILTEVMEAYSSASANHLVDSLTASYEPRAGDITQYAPWKNLAIFVAPFSNSPGLVRLGQFDGG